MVRQPKRRQTRSQAALTMIENLRLAFGQFKILLYNCAPGEGEEHKPTHDRASFAWANECSKCGNGITIL